LLLGGVGDFSRGGVVDPSVFGGYGPFDRALQHPHCKYILETSLLQNTPKLQESKEEPELVVTCLFASPKIEPRMPFWPVEALS
jgi:hypothetical protein